MTAEPRYVDATPVPTDVSPWPWDDAAAAWRLDRLRDHLPFAVPAHARFTTGASNDVWMFDDLVLRVCWRGDRDRLIREARLLQALPAEIPHASVHEFGRTLEVSWTLATLVPGRPLDEVAEELPAGQARELYREFAYVLASLNDWTPPADIAALLRDRPAMSPDDLLSVWATDLMPFPVSRALTMIDLARPMRFVDSALIDATRERLEELASFDPFANPNEPQCVLHVDATPGNLLVHNGKIEALLDFEWARMGPRDHELVSLVRMVQHGPWPDGPMQRLPILQWLEADYPRLFAHPDLDNRLWLSEIVYLLRGLIWWPPDEPEATLVPEHHLHTLRRLVEAPWPRRFDR